MNFYKAVYQRRSAIVAKLDTGDFAVIRTDIPNVFEPKVLSAEVAAKTVVTKRDKNNKLILADNQDDLSYYYWNWYNRNSVAFND